jgi:hypothetical protein
MKKLITDESIQSILLATAAIGIVWFILTL